MVSSIFDDMSVVLFTNSMEKCLFAIPRRWRGYLLSVGCSSAFCILFVRWDGIHGALLNIMLGTHITLNLHIVLRAHTSVRALLSLPLCIFCLKSIRGLTSGRKSKRFYCVENCPSNTMLSEWSCK